MKRWEESDVVSASEVDVDEVMDSLRDDLEKLFNTRRGTVLIDDDYGLPDFTHLMNGYSAPDVGEIERNLMQQIRQYETRLQSVQLVSQKADPASASLKFGLNAMFRHKDQEHNFVASLQFADNGSVNVSLS